MDALREYSPSDEESQGNGEKSPCSSHQHHSTTQRHPSSPVDDTHRPKSPTKKKNSDSRKRSPSPRSSRPGGRRRSRSPHYRGRRPSRSPPTSRRDHYTGSSRYRSHGDRRRSPSPSRHNRHSRQRSRSPQQTTNRRHSSTTDSRHNEDKKPSGPRNDADVLPSVQQDQTSTRTQWSTDVSLTPEQKLEQALAASRSNKPTTAPGLPSYINTSVINPQHFKAIQQKRKLLWGKGKEKQTASKESWNKWESASFEGDDKGETQLKFRRLMGIKDDMTKTDAAADKPPTKKTNKLLDDLEAQYETSRFMTHLAKGAGLGFGLGAQISQNKVDPNDTDDVNESHANR